MNSEEKGTQQKIRQLLDQQRFAVLSTQRGGQPYSSLMAFAYTPDLKRLLVATAQATRKYQNILQDRRVSLLVDNRSNCEEDFHEAVALTIVGTAEEVRSSERSRYSEMYLARHPYLDGFLSASSTSFIQVVIDSYLLVSQFQDVQEYHIGTKRALF